MLDLYKLESERRKAAADKAELFEFYNDNYSLLIHEIVCLRNAAGIVQSLKYKQGQVLTVLHHHQVDEDENGKARFAAEGDQAIITRVDPSNLSNPYAISFAGGGWGFYNDKEVDEMFHSQQ
jgi:hypothetical protein